MIRHAALREIICSDSFTSVTRTNLALSLACDLILLLLHLQVIEACLKYLECLVFILDL